MSTGRSWKLYTEERRRHVRQRIKYAKERRGEDKNEGKRKKEKNVA
jgi:hypothetical protein